MFPPKSTRPLIGVGHTNSEIRIAPPAVTISVMISDFERGTATEPDDPQNPPHSLLDYSTAIEQSVGDREATNGTGNGPLDPPTPEQNSPTPEQNQASRDQVSIPFPPSTQHHTHAPVRRFLRVFIVILDLSHITHMPAPAVSLLYHVLEERKKHRRTPTLSAGGSGDHS